MMKRSFLVKGMAVLLFALTFSAINAQSDTKMDKKKDIAMRSCVTEFGQSQGRRVRSRQHAVNELMEGFEG